MFLNKLFNSMGNNENVAILSTTEFKNAIQKNPVQLIDVRTPNEFAGGSIKGAQNMNIFDGSGFQKAAAKLNKDNPVYLFCQSGNRSKSASKLLLQMGFSQIYDLKGGYSNWS
jgi:rhodanese-related sulfurtransferase